MSLGIVRRRLGLESLFAGLVLNILPLLFVSGQSLAAPLVFITPAQADALQAAADRGHPAPASVVGSSRSSRQEAALYAAFHDLGNWTGRIVGWRIPAGAKAVEPGGLWGSFVAPGAGPQPHSTASLMDAESSDWPARRLVLSSNPAGDGIGIGISFEPDSFPDEHGSERDRIAYLRGDRNQERSNGGLFRDRASRHGPIVHSRPWFQPGRPASAHSSADHADFRAARAKRGPMLYAGANDGMLHGFDADSGEERFAYLPAGLQPRLAELSDAGQPRTWTVDGSPLAGDLYLGAVGSSEAAGWRSYLAGFPGRGGRGYFVLDITDPENFRAANARDLVVLDRTSDHGMDPDIGHILDDPVMEHTDPGISRQITRLNDGRWALVLGNGYNSRNERAVLLIQYLDGGRELHKIAADEKTGTGTGTGNGLAAPRLIDIDGDGSADLAYAGDLHGNLWKFDLRDASATRWQVAFAGRPLFVAQDGSPAARRQPITTAPAWKAHPEGGLILVFGTGRLLTAADFSDTQPQTLYGIHDDAPSSATAGKGPLLHGRQDLVAQELRPIAGAAATIASQPVPHAGSKGRRGWYLDLPLPGERLLRHAEWFEGDLADLWTSLPARAGSAGSAAAAARSFRHTLDMVHGTAPKSRLHGHLPFAAGASPARIEARPGVALRSDSHEFRLGVPGQEPIPEAKLLDTVIRRPSWRQWQ